nr:uncharacterized protein LOC113828191 [Penaeus vannamei]
MRHQIRIPIMMQAMAIVSALHIISEAKASHHLFEVGNQEMFSSFNSFGCVNVVQMKEKVGNQEMFSSFNSFGCVNVVQMKEKVGNQEMFSSFNSFGCVNVVQMKEKVGNQEMFSSFNSFGCVNVVQMKGKKASEIRHKDQTDSDAGLPYTASAAPAQEASARLPPHTQPSVSLPKGLRCRIDLRGPPSPAQTSPSSARESKVSCHTGVFPAAEGTGEPYGINRKVVEGAARAGASAGNPAPSPRQLDGVPVPALNQVVAGDPPGGEVADVFEAPGEGNGTARAPGPGAAGGPSGDPAGARLRGTGVKGSASIPECNKGQGQLRFEKITGTALARSPLDNDVIRDTKIPANVAAVCATRCLKDNTAQQQLSNGCTAFDFIPGVSIDYYNSKNITFQESKCFLTRQADPNVQPKYEDRRGTSHFREVCYSASTVRSECPTRMYVMERVRNHHFVPDNSGRDFKFQTSEDCQNSCLNQYADENQASTFVCRSATYDKTTGDCFHSQYTRRTHTDKFVPNANFDYYENTCLSADRRCPKNKLTFMMEKNKELRGAHITEVHFGVSEQECKEKCLDSVFIFCRRLEYTEESKKCVIIDEDSVSQDYALTDTSSNATYYELFCIDGAKVKGDYLFDSKEDVTEQLNERRYTEVRTAFQLYRNRRLQLKPGFRGSRAREVNRVTLAECLDECLEERSFTCRSVSYSDRYQSCELSEYDKLSGNLEYDNDFHYFENLMGTKHAVDISGSNLGGSSSSGGGNYGGGYSGSGSSRCFEVIGTRQRLRRTYIRDYLTVSSVDECKRRCEQTHSYYCKSFNFRYATSWDNCELSDEDTIGYLSLNNPSHFESDSTSDYYERTSNCGSDYGKTPDGLDVQQVCSPDGMEFTLRTEEPFRGRIYTYGYYDRCFARGSGSSITVLKISGPRGFPDCGTTRFGETTTNIVVVQFSDNVQTSLDKRYNLTCTVVGPSESVVTSGYIGAGSGAPTPIEYLPAENQLQSRVKLQILYGGRPTTTIAVGDPLTFRLESQRGFNLVSDIFATNVMAKDPYSGRTVNLIDSRGCPVDNYVFPSLGKARDGDGLEARFNAFKIPESNFLIFEATVRNCRGGCVPARCTLGNGREETESYGRRRRDAGDDPSALALTDGVEDEDEEDPDEEEQVHGIYEVYLSRDEIDDSVPLALLDEVCLAASEYYSLVAGLVITISGLVASLLAIVYCVRKHRQLDSKNAAADAGNPYHSQPQQKSKFNFPGSHARTLTQPARQVYFPASEATASAPQGEDGAATSSRYPDPSEPIYTDPSLFERSGALQVEVPPVYRPFGDASSPTSC